MFFWEQDYLVLSSRQIHSRWNSNQCSGAKSFYCNLKRWLALRSEPEVDENRERYIYIFLYIYCTAVLRFLIWFLGPLLHNKLNTMTYALLARCTMILTNVQVISKPRQIHFVIPWQLNTKHHKIYWHNNSPFSVVIQCNTFQLSYNAILFSCHTM